LANGGGVVKDPPTLTASSNNAIPVAEQRAPLKLHPLASRTRTRAPVCMDSRIRDYHPMTGLRLNNEDS